MIIIYNEEEYTLPDELSDITLLQHVNWSFTYGKALAERRAAAMKEENADIKDLELNLIYLDEASCAISFYSGIPLEEVQQNIEVGTVVGAYLATQLVLAVEETNIVVENTYDWEATNWVINAPNISMSEDLTLDDFVAVKMLAEAVIKLSAGDWSQMYAICAAYFRHTGESFNRDYLEPGHPRYELMKTLPLNMALSVAKFITASMSVFKEMIIDHLYAQLPDEVPPPITEPDPIDDVPTPEP